MQQDIKSLRKLINDLDQQLVTLLNKRAEVVLEIGKVNARSSVKMYDPAREGAVLDHVVTLNKGPLGKGAMEELFATILTVCREMQDR